jgi:hypothetical protein
MTQLQLVEVDARKEQIKRGVKAISTSWSTLAKYCQETFGQEPSDDSNPGWEVTYKIEKSDIVIVQENTNKFDK